MCDPALYLDFNFAVHSGSCAAEAVTSCDSKSSVSKPPSVTISGVSTSGQTGSALNGMCTEELRYGAVSTIGNLVESFVDKQTEIVTKTVPKTYLNPLKVS
jgi:hypothetical protein